LFNTTQLLTAMVVATSVVGNSCLSRGMHQVGRIVSPSPLDYIRTLINPWVLVGICILIIWMISNLSLLSRADLTFVLPVTSCSYVLIAIAGHFWLHDRISWEHWVGIVVITVGVILAEETPPLTAGQKPPEHSP
jgi:drug/metabolite transporter (DMT)-like permease